MHCPFIAEDVVLTDFEMLLEVTVVEDFTLLLVLEVTVERVDDLVLLAVEDFTVLLTVEEVLELLIVEDAVLPTLLLDLTLAHTNCVCPSSHAPLMLKVSKTIPSMELRFAPVNALNKTVYVCVDPVMPVKVVK